METTTLSPALARLVADATAAGFEIVERGSGFAIYKGRPGRTPTLGVMLLLGPNGTFWYSYRIDVRLDLANKITTIKTTRKVLGL